MSRVTTKTSSPSPNFFSGRVSSEFFVSFVTHNTSTTTTTNVYTQLPRPNQDDVSFALFVSMLLLSPRPPLYLNIFDMPDFFEFDSVEMYNCGDID